jgi:hypothetical protein
MNTQDSWLFHITKILLHSTMLKNPRTKLQFITLHFWYYKKFTQQYRYGNRCKSLYFFVLLKKKNSIRITKKSHVLWKWNQNNKIKSLIYPKQNLWFSITKNLEPFLFFPKLCLRKIPFLLSRTLHFGQSQVTSSWFQIQQEFKIQTNNVPWSIPIQMPCSSKPCTHPTPLIVVYFYDNFFMWFKPSPLPPSPIWKFWNEVSQAH